MRICRRLERAGWSPVTDPQPEGSTSCGPRGTGGTAWQYETTPGKTQGTHQPGLGAPFAQKGGASAPVRQAVGCGPTAGPRSRVGPRQRGDCCQRSEEERVLDGLRLAGLAGSHASPGSGAVPRLGRLGRSDASPGSGAVPAMRRTVRPPSACGRRWHQPPVTSPRRPWAGRFRLGRAERPVQSARPSCRQLRRHRPRCLVPRPSVELKPQRSSRRQPPSRSLRPARRGRSQPPPRSRRGRPPRPCRQEQHRR